MMLGNHLAHSASPRLRGETLCVAARAVALIALLVASAAWADGGEMCVTQTAGPFEITVFTAPSPPRVGPIDISVLVVDHGSHAPLLDADVQVELRSPTPPALPRTATASHAGAVNKLLYVTTLEAPSASPWVLEARVRKGGESASVTCELAVESPLGALLAYWPYLALPVVAIGFFALQQWIKRSP